MIYNKLCKTIPIPSNCFFNLTSTDLSPFKYLFNLGIKHVTTPQDVTNEEISLAFHNFKHRTLWQLSLDNKQVDIIDDSYIRQYHPKLKIRKEKIKPCYMISPHHIIHDSLNEIEEYVSLYMSNNPITHRKCPIARDIHNIKQRYPHIVFKPADKNIGLVAMDIIQYNSIILDHLNEGKNYSLIVEDNGSFTRHLLKSLHNEFITFRNSYYWFTYEKNLLFQEHHFTWPKFHCMPKLHKKGTLKGRPIAGQVNWITTPISRILDIRLQPYLLRFPNILKNSQTLVNELETYNRNSNFIQAQDIWFITGDITALYPNIKLEKLYSIIETIDN
jgi:hypothetical protein